MAEIEAPVEVRRTARRVAVASVAGTTMEYYDFAIYGLASALVLDTCSSRR